jgi:DNA-directed RNA polymerase specialized sigma24 family protein
MELLTRGSVTCWLEAAGNGDADATQQLWNRYFDQLIGLARVRLRGIHRVSDEEDVAIRAMKSVLVGIKQGRFPQLHDRTGLWPLLVTIVARKAQSQLRWHYAQLRSPALEDHYADLAEIVVDELEDPAYRELARFKLEGFTNEEIAQKMGVSTFTVYRKLRIMRRYWEESAVGNDRMME